MHSFFFCRIEPNSDFDITDVLLSSRPYLRVAMPPKKIIGARAATLPSVLVRTACSSPGTPRRVAASSKGACQNGAESIVTDCQTCPVCALVIVETTDDMESQEVLLCEGSCNHWYHRWCAGVTKARYEALSSSEDPFFCPSCSAIR